MSAAITWVLVGNASVARLFESHNIERDLALVKTYQHPESRNKDLDFVSDKNGHFHTNNGAGSGSFASTSQPKDIELERFAKELASDMEVGRNSNRYDRLVVIMPPHCHGVFNKACNDQVLNRVIHHVEKDYTKKQDRELLKFLSDLARF